MRHRLGSQEIPLSLWRLAVAITIVSHWLGTLIIVGGTESGPPSTIMTGTGVGFQSSVELASVDFERAAQCWHDKSRALYFLFGPANLISNFQSLHPPPRSNRL